ncbi:hypothetical protein [Flavonifractor plautii]|uniref:hypothetical protein n=1 Tax=Flavonifractor plautii TaxID=292800 RepID=UPI001957C6AF|nr:hypothetical protein [Flavonifractor plautii]MBM6665718.1 hypothetical protein [Flavonifractor plautii]
MVNADFERCTDFLARMIEKYGGELDLPKTEENEKNAITPNSTQDLSDISPKKFPTSSLTINETA